VARRFADQLEDHEAQIALVEHALGAPLAASPETRPVAPSMKPEFPGGMGLAVVMNMSVHRCYSDMIRCI
jgi:hypothetical protein